MSTAQRWQCALLVVLVLASASQFLLPGVEEIAWEWIDEAVVLPATAVSHILATYPPSRANGDVGDRPLTSEYLLKGINFLGINITRPVVFGEIQTREATIIRLHSKDVAELNEVLPQGEFKRSHDSCAFVGNSRRVLQEEWGAEIDAMDAVMRLDEAPTKGFESHVGRRTTYRALGYNYLKALLASKPDRTGKRVSTGAKTNVVYGDHPVALYVDLVRKYPENMNYMLGSYLRFEVRKLTQKLQDRYNSVSFFPPPTRSSLNIFENLVFLFQICQTVHVFGMDPDVPQPYYGMKDGVLTVSSDMAPDAALGLVLRAMGAEGYIENHG